MKLSKGKRTRSGVGPPEVRAGRLWRETGAGSVTTRPAPCQGPPAFPLRGTVDARSGDRERSVPRWSGLTASILIGRGRRRSPPDSGGNRMRVGFARIPRIEGVGRSGQRESSSRTHVRGTKPIGHRSANQVRRIRGVDEKGAYGPSGNTDQGV